MNQSELIGAFSHEIRNPLTLINSSLQLLETDCPAVLDCALWPQIRQDVRDLLRLLNDMSSLTKSCQSSQTFFPVSRLFSDMDASVRPMMREKGIRFVITIEPSLSGVSLFADSLKLKEAIINLLLNAMDAVSELNENREILLLAELAESAAISSSTQTPGPKVSSPDTIPATQNIISKHIPHFVNQRETCILIHVRDNGPGIPSEHMDTLFEPFVTHKPHGTGLGLGIVQNILAQHGGSVSVDTCNTTPGSYTDFCLRLPAFRQTG